MSRVPLPYGPKVLELFRNPRNAGAMEDATVSATAGSPICGDVIAIYLKIGGGDVIERATFESYGCAANIATASILTEMVKGKTLREAWEITWRDVAEELGGLPSIKLHCGALAVGALRRAIRAYYERHGKPSWLPEEATLEEKQALEAERMGEMLSRRIGGGEVEQPPR